MDPIDPLDEFALRLLSFVEDNINEALESSWPRLWLLIEADTAMRILQKTLQREDEGRHAALMLAWVFEETFQTIAKDSPPDLAKKIRAALQVKMRARAYFSESVRQAATDVVA
jgi:hypothetical protein